MPLENKWFVALAAVCFMLALWYSDGSLAAAFGSLALVLGVGWSIGRIFARK
jgi:hypothetical protein